MRHHPDPHTIQTWPSGASFDYRGDPDGPPAARSLRAGHYTPRVRCACSRTFLDEGQLFMQGSAAPLSSVFEHPSEDPRAGRHCVGDPLNYPARVSLCPYCKGEGFTDNPTKNPWRKGTPAEWRAIRVSLRAELYWRQNGLGCDSALVSDLIQLDGNIRRNDPGYDLASAFSADAIRNLYADPSDWGFDRCVAYVDEQGLTYPDTLSIDVAIRATSTRAALIDAIAAIDPEPFTGEGMREPALRTLLKDLIHDCDSDMEELRDVCRDHAQDNPAEVYEWWRVTDRLCQQLHAIGEVTIDNGYGHWWGRTCTGQSLLMDGTLQTIAAKFETEDRP